MQVIILDEYAEYYKSKLKPGFPDVEFHAVLKEEEMGDLIENADILMLFKISDETIKRASKLKWIQAATVGVDVILKLPSLKEEVLVTSSRGIHGPQMSEMAVMLMIALSRGFPQIIRNQERKHWERRPAKLLWQKKVGILGLGVSGQAIAEKCKVFGMTVYGINRTRKEFENVDFYYPIDGLTDVIREVDYFVIVIPSTPDTRGMVNAEAIAAMKPTSYLVNLGRGDLVDTEALIDALESKKIAGAALDVFPDSPPNPLTKDSPLWEMKNVIVTPNVAGMTDIYPDQILPIFEENLRRFLEGERRDLINFIER